MLFNPDTIIVSILDKNHKKEGEMARCSSARGTRVGKFFSPHYKFFGRCARCGGSYNLYNPLVASRTSSISCRQRVRLIWVFIPTTIISSSVGNPLKLMVVACSPSV